LADAAELSISYVHEIEKGKKYPKSDKILVLAKVLDTTYDELVSVHASKRLQPIIDLLESEFFRVFPMEMFGISAEKLLELFSNAPDKLNAFISTVIKLARNYQMESENFYTAALRSYQDMQDNYFEEMEQTAVRFKQQHAMRESDLVSGNELERLLKEGFDITVDRKKMAGRKALKGIRAYFSVERKRLYINKDLTTAQENFLLARELGFQYMKIVERPYETVMLKATSFEQLFNNYKASYFASAFLMDEGEMIRDVKKWAASETWNPSAFMAFTVKYDVTPEMFVTRLSNVLPKHFKINDLFFIRLQADADLKVFKMNKELHLSRMHKPYANELSEHYCRRWVSVNAIKQLRANIHLDKEVESICDAQVSNYWETDLSYFCLTVAKPNTSRPKESSSVTLGILIHRWMGQPFRLIEQPVEAGADNRPPGVTRAEQLELDIRAMTGGEIVAEVDEQ